ncbi:MAG: proline racemase family protein [Candidatus Bathyarchaeota archaeon]|nr:MAG: proline racemase family protein [Candidatus Bathyarchaeota archaeon]
MKFDRLISTLETHTAGEPTRIVVGGIPFVPGPTMLDKRRYLEDNLETVRTSLMQEPRGHSNMYGAILTPPVSDDASFGVIFMDTTGYWNMCGHGTIGVVTAVVETGMVDKKSPTTTIKLDTVAGPILAYAHIKNEAVTSVTVRNVPAFWQKFAEIEVPQIGTVTCDVAYGGNFCAIVDADAIGIKVERKNLKKLIEVGMSIRKAANQQIELQHPEKPFVNEIHHVQICSKLKHAKDHVRNVVVSGEKQADRSPCGTATCALMATLYHKQRLALNHPFVSESIIGTAFNGKLVSPSRIGGSIDAVIPEITGSAYLTGFYLHLISSDDPLKHGFLV